MGTVLLNPFGTDPVDHDLGDFCRTIERECNAAQQRHTEALHLPPSKRAIQMKSPSSGRDADAILRERTPHGQPSGRVVQLTDNL